MTAAPRGLVSFALLSLIAAPAAAQINAAAPMSSMDAMAPVMDRDLVGHMIFDQLEGRAGGAGTDFRWSGQGWLGTDYDKLWVKSEGFRRSNGSVDDGRHELLYDRAISTYWDLQGGVRSDSDSRPTRNWAAFGVEGLAPLFFNVEATAYVSDQGHLAARFEASYDLLLTQRLILQPQVEINLYSKADPARLVGAGFSDIDTGLRLRYEIDRKFAPYIGVSYDGKFGQTAAFARSKGESIDDVRFVFGIRMVLMPSRSTWRTVLATLAIGGGTVVLGAAVFVYGGFLNVAATEHHWPATHWLMETARVRSIRARAHGIIVPPMLDSAANLAMGTEHFAAHCAVCHGAPGVPKGDIALGIYPPPPDLAIPARRYTDVELFWIIKHGIKMAGMPAWADHSDAEIWATVAFLKQLATGMTAQQYGELVKANMMHGMPHAPGGGSPTAAEMPHKH